MDILVNNPIALMYGPHFLGFYAGIIASVGAAANFIVKGSKQAEITVPYEPDPYEIAYLRQGEKAVIKLTCLRLLEKGLIRVENDKLEKAGAESDRSQLSAIEETVWDYLTKPLMAETVKNSLTLKNQIVPLCNDYRDSLIAAGYINPIYKGYIVGGVSAFMVVGLGSYKMMSALSRGHHNILFLLMMAIAATAIFAMITCPPYSRLTTRGKQYLETLQQAFSGLSGELQSPPTEPDYNTSLLVALHDLDIIKNTAIEPYQSLVKPKRVKTTFLSYGSSSGGSSYGCSNSCGSSCGSSCGGGCGGCGGCGG